MIPVAYPVPIVSLNSKSNTRKKRRHKFTKEEDETLIQLFNQFGKNWKIIAKGMNGLTPRQCRERYQDYLSPGIRNESWTPEEEKLLVEKFNEYGPKWTTIAKFFNARTDVNIKNHWTIMNQRLEKSKKIEIEKEKILKDLNKRKSRLRMKKRFFPQLNYHAFMSQNSRGQYPSLHTHSYNINYNNTAEMNTTDNINNDSPDDTIESVTDGQTENSEFLQSNTNDEEKDIFEPVTNSIDAFEIDSIPYDIKSL